MRGGRGGRGRGRFGRGGFLQTFRDSYDDVGDQDEDGPLQQYPPLSLPQPSTISPDDLYCIQKNTEIIKRFQKSAYNLKRKSDEEKDNIERYSDKYLRAENELELYEYVVEGDNTCATPQELLVDIKKIALKSLYEGKYDPTSSSSSEKLKSLVNTDESMKLLFQRLESKEKNSNFEVVTNKNKESGGGGYNSDSDGNNEDGDVLDDGDYGKDYYASDNEGGGDDDGGGDHEATFD